VTVEEFLWNTGAEWGEEKAENGAAKQVVTINPK
jgi:hypothetical protein